MKAALTLLILALGLSGCITPQEIYKNKWAQMRMEQRIGATIQAALPPPSRLGQHPRNY
ncbi:hypothetical protein SAMN05519104_8127 [Rhizobiales bacterium GAS188]|nr:hypothetical protein SAMN05519104_8127 [Rhizobiales bacterium GAS188]